MFSDVFNSNIIHGTSFKFTLEENAAGLVRGKREKILHSPIVYSVRRLERSELGSHEIGPIHSAPSLGQSIDGCESSCSSARILTPGSSAYASTSTQ